MRKLMARRTLFRDLILTLSAITLIAVTILGAILFYMATVRQERKVNQNAQKLMGEVSQAIALPLMNLDGDTISQIAEAYLSSDFITGIVIRDDNQIFWEKKQSSAAPQITEKSDVTVNGMNVGNLEISFSRDSIREIQMTIVWIMLATLACVVLVGIPVLYRLIHHLVHNPLVYLKQGLRRIAVGDDAEPLLLMAQDDMNDIIYEVNQMAEKIRERNQQIQESEIRYRDIFDHAGDGIFQMTPEGELIRLNQSMALLFGFESPEEMLSEFKETYGKTFFTPEIRALLSQPTTEGSTLSGFETRLKKKDESEIWVKIKARTVSDVSGELLYVEGFMEDITQRIDMQNAILKAKEELESQVEIRTRSLMEKTEKMERMNRLFIHRELAMKKLKENIRALSERIEHMEGHNGQA